MWAVGVPQTFCNLLPRFPGIFLFPVFAPFIFGPKKCCGCREPNDNKMQLSFFHTYGNILIWGGGAVPIFYHFQRYRPQRARTEDTINVVLLAILPYMALLTILTLLYQISEKTCCLKGCKCCSSCCCPFTQRSVHYTDEGQQKIKTQRHSNSQEQGFELNELV